MAAIAAPVREQIEAGQAPDADAVAVALAAWMDGAATHHLARLELELQGAREPAHAARMTQAAQVFWDMCATIVAGLGSLDPARDGRAMAVMLDGLLIDRLTHPPQDQDVVVAAVRWLLSGVPGGGAQPGPRKR